MLGDISCLRADVARIGTSSLLVVLHLIEVVDRVEGAKWTICVACL